MLIKVALILSVLLQFGAAIFAISLIRKTKLNVSWIMISTGFFLMALRRLFELISLMNTDNLETTISSWIGVLISLLMFVGTIYIRKIFNLQERINKLRKENESRVLSAIIQTEEKERQKFSKELHDGLGPILSSVKMAISAINLSTIGEKSKHIIEKADHAINEAIITIKEISNNLSPHILQRYGLDKAIKSITDTIIVNKKITINYFSNIKEVRFDYNTELVLYRIVGELITNTLKHAGATEINISLLTGHDSLELNYIDNGTGFDFNKNMSKGMGLSNIRSRIKSLDGKVDFSSGTGKGFHLKLTVPK